MQVMCGQDAGKQSVVVKVLRKKNVLFLRGVRLAKRRLKASEESSGGFVYREQPVHYSQLALVDPSDNNPCKIKMEFLKDGTKVRVSKRTGTVIPKPASLKESRFKNNRDGPKDTKPDVALLKTFDEMSLVPALDELTVAKVHEKLLMEKEEEEAKRLAYEKARAKYRPESSEEAKEKPDLV